MATIEEAIRQMLVNNNGTLPATRISYGYRPQSDILPAVTFTISSNTAESIGSAPIRQATFSVNAIAELAIDAAAMIDAVRAACVPGVYDGKTISAVVITDQSLTDPITGISDEQEPSIATVNAIAFYED